MILSNYAKFLHAHDDELFRSETTSLKLMHEWLELIINKNPKTNTEKIVHREIMYAKNDNGDYLIIGKSDSGRVLVQALIKFAKSYDNYIRAKWLESAEKSYHNKN